jgi:hypothetical protein
MTRHFESGIELPFDAYRWNKAHRGAVKRGMRDHLAGVPFDACPYGDLRKDCGRLTWSRAFIACWRDGWRWAKKHKEINTPK